MPTWKNQKYLTRDETDHKHIQITRRTLSRRVGYGNNLLQAVIKSYIWSDRVTHLSHQQLQQLRCVTYACWYLWRLCDISGKDSQSIAGGNVRYGDLFFFDALAKMRLLVMLIRMRPSKRIRYKNRKSQCCSPRWKSLSSRILEDQFTSPCPWTSSPSPWTTKSLKIFKDFALCKLSVMYDHLMSKNSVTATVHEDTAKNVLLTDVSE